MNTSQMLFWFLTALSILSALMMVTSRNPVHSVLWLILVFFSISGHYILMNAQFLAVVNMIVYAGAIMVLFLFVIMLMNTKADAEPRHANRMRLAGTLAGGSLLLVLVAALRETELRGVALEGPEGDIGLVARLGSILFTDYVVAFELSSILFLSAMVGAVMIGRKN